MQRLKNIVSIINTKVKDNTVPGHAVKLATNNQIRLTVIEVINDTQANEKLATDHENSH